MSLFTRYYVTFMRLSRERAIISHRKEKYFLKEREIISREREIISHKREIISREM